MDSPCDTDFGDIVDISVLFSDFVVLYSRPYSAGNPVRDHPVVGSYVLFGLCYPALHLFVAVVVVADVAGDSMDTSGRRYSVSFR